MSNFRWIVPNMASDIRERIRREAYLTNEIIIRYVNMDKFNKAKFKVN